MTSLAPRSLLRGSSRIGSSLYFKVKPALSWALSKVKNFSWLKAATTNSLLRLRISTFDLNL